jgi:hypothetical protein
MSDRIKLALEDLRQDLQNIDHAIALFERMRLNRPQRGRPPKILATFRLGNGRKTLRAAAAR